MQGSEAASARQTNGDAKDGFGAKWATAARPVIGLGVFAVSVALAALCVALEMTTTYDASLWGPAGGAIPFWAPAGFGVATLTLLSGRRRMDAATALLAAELVVWTSLEGWGAGSILSIALLAQSYLGATLLRRYQRSGGVLGGIRDVLGHLAAAFLAPLIPSVVVALAVAAVDGIAFLAVAQAWYLANALGILVVAPFIVVWTRRVRRPLRHPVWRDLLATGFAIAVPIAFIFFAPGSDGLLVPLAFLTLPALLWTAWTTGPRGATAAVLSVSLLAITLTAAGLGPFTGVEAMALSGWVALQSYLVVCSLTTMFFTAAVAQQREARDSLEARNVALAEAALMSTAFEHAVEGIVRIGNGDEVLYANPAFKRLVSEPTSDEPRFWVDLVDVRDRESMRRAVEEARRSGRSRLECRLPDRAGGTRETEMTIVADGELADVPEAQRAPQGLHVFIRDITERKVAQTRLTHQANHDALTGLPNRAHFLRATRDAISPQVGASAAVDGIAVLYLDLDRFKIVNDSLGHESGDRLLRAVARRLLTALADTGFLARLGGDEFGVLVEGVDDLAEVLHLADRVHRAFSDAFTVGSQEMYSSVSIGIAVSWDDSTSATDLLRHADIAMYKAKDAGRARSVVFDEHLRDGIETRLTLENALHRALDRNELQPWYQPFYDIEGSTITGVEALVRWVRPGSPPETAASFIESAEECGLVVPLGTSMLTRSCAQVATWRDAGLFPEAARLHVNVSPRQVSHGDLTTTIATILDSTGLAPQCLCVEVTETVLLHDPDRSRLQLAELAESGVGISIDDFGTGYSSLSHLRRFPLDCLKIDRSFVHGILHRSEDSAIVEATILLAHSLGVYVIAEGVESEGQRARLEEMGCDHVQGFHLARPAPAEDVMGMLSA